MKKFFLVLSLSLLYVSILNAQTGNAPSSSDSVINKWTHSVFNIEVRYNDSTLDGASGAAVLLRYNGENYILTARHVVINNQSNDTNEIANTIILVENGGAIDKNKETFDANHNIWINGPETTFFYFKKWMHLKNYIFSSVSEDLAIIHLRSNDGTENGFANTLMQRGYKFITIEDIDTTCQIEANQSVSCFGFPLESTIDTNANNALIQIRSRSITLPSVSFGITLVDYGKYFFESAISIFHGYSGGPLVRNNKLIGIVHGPIRQLSSDGAPSLEYYLLQHLIFIKSSLIMPLLRKAVSENR